MYVEWLFLDLNSYFASVEQQLNPKLRNRPVVVVPMLEDSTSAIAASYEAKAFGIKTGTSVRDAKRYCPEAVFIEADHHHYVEYHHKIVAAVESCIPVESIMSIDEMICKLTGSQRNVEVAKSIAAKIKHTLRTEVGEYITASIGLATNRFLAKVASDMQKPNGLTVLLKEELPQRLYSLSLRDFPGIGSKMEKRLKEAGIYQTQVLCESSRAAMKQIWGGVIGEQFYEWLRGNDTEMVETKTRSISHSHVMAPELRNIEGTWMVAQKLMHKAAYRLRKENLWCRGLYFSVSLTNGEYVEEKMKIEDCQDNFTLLENLKKLWEKLQKPMIRMMGSVDRYTAQGKAVVPVKASVYLLDLQSDQERNLSLFTDDRGLKVSQRLDEINAKFGKGAIYFGGVRGSSKSSNKEIATNRIAFTSIPDLDAD